MRWGGRKGGGDADNGMKGEGYKDISEEREIVMTQGQHFLSQDLCHICISMEREPPPYPREGAFQLAKSYI